MNLGTTSLGLQLPHPLIVGSGAAAYEREHYRKMQ